MEKKIDPKFNIHENYNRVNIVNPYRYEGVSPGYEPETTAFMQDADVNIPNDSTIFYSGTIYETTGSILWTAIDNFIKREKTAGRWTNIIYFRPRIGGTALAHAVNLINPALFKGVYYGTWIHDGNGSSVGTYMTTGFYSSSQQTAGASGQGAVLLGYNIPVGYPAILGAYVTDTQGAVLYAPRSSTRFSFRYNSAYTVLGGVTSINAMGAQLVNRVSSLTKLIHNGIEVISKTDSGTLPNIETYEGSFNLTGSAGLSLIGRIGSTYQVKNFTADDSLNFTLSVSELEFDLKRKTW